jgi:hypothetical protein
MTKNNNFLLAMEALTELAPEINAAKADFQPSKPILSEILADAAPLPREALFLGMADDQLPILLNLHDSVPGPLLVIADEGAGKTAFLQLVAQALIRVHDRSEVQFGVVTPNPEEWKRYERAGHCAGVFPVYQKKAKDFIFSLGEWAHTNKSRQSVILLIDDLNRVAEADPDAKDTLRWLLLRGPARHVWPIVTLKSSQINEVQPWLEFFRTRIFGMIKNTSLVQYITGTTDSGIESLSKGTRFAMREGLDWLQFWIPRLDPDEAE